MKKYISIIILTFVIAAAFVGCVPSGSQENKNDIGINDGENTNGNGEDAENVGDNATDGGENAENNGDSSTEGGESTENNGGSSTEGSESTENNGNSSTNGGESTKNNGDSSTEGGESTENGNNGTTDGGENEKNDSNISSDNSENNGSGEDNEEDTPTYVVGSEVGNLFASVTLERLDGGTVSPDNYRGKIVIVNIWATWCPPCKAELPDFNNIANEYADEVVIIAAHDYAGRANAPDYVQTNFPDTKIIFAYDSYNGDAYIAAGGDGYIPFTAILDQNGVIVYSDSGILTHEQLRSIIEGLLK